MLLVSVSMLSFKQGDENPNVIWLFCSSAWWWLRWAFYIIDPTHAVFTSWPGKAPRREEGSRSWRCAYANLDAVRFGNITGDEEIQPCCLATGRQDLTPVVGSGVEEGGAHLVSRTVCSRKILDYSNGWKLFMTFSVSSLLRTTERLVMYQEGKHEWALTSTVRGRGNRTQLHRSNT